jgi:hypothetical protein
MLEAVQGCIESVADSGTVEINPGGPSPWTFNGGNPEFHWMIDFARSSQKITTIPGAARTMNAQRDMTVVIEGWYPVARADESFDKWRDMLDAVMLVLETKRFLGLTTGIMLISGPTIAEDTQAMKTSLHQGDIKMMCHFCRMVCRYSQEFSFTTVD